MSALYTEESLAKHAGALPEEYHCLLRAALDGASLLNDTVGVAVEELGLSGVTRSCSCYVNDELQPCQALSAEDLPAAVFQIVITAPPVTAPLAVRQEFVEKRDQFLEKVYEVLPKIDETPEEEKKEEEKEEVWDPTTRPLCASMTTYCDQAEIRQFSIHINGVTFGKPRQMLLSRKVLEHRALALIRQYARPGVDARLSPFEAVMSLKGTATAAQMSHAFRTLLVPPTKSPLVYSDPQLNMQRAFLRCTLPRMYYEPLTDHSELTSDVLAAVEAFWSHPPSARGANLPCPRHHGSTTSIAILVAVSLMVFPASQILVVLPSEDEVKRVGELARAFLELPENYGGALEARDTGDDGYHITTFRNTPDEAHATHAHISTEDFIVGEFSGPMDLRVVTIAMSFVQLHFQLVVRHTLRDAPITAAELLNRPQEQIDLQASVYAASRVPRVGKAEEKKTDEPLPALEDEPGELDYDTFLDHPRFFEFGKCDPCRENHIEVCPHILPCELPPWKNREKEKATRAQYGTDAQLRREIYGVAESDEVPQVEQKADQAPEEDVPDLSHLTLTEQP